MNMAMRNQWVEVSVSHRHTVSATGPRAKKDTMGINLYQDNKGDSQRILEIRCYSREEEGKTLCVTKVINTVTGEVIMQYESPR